MWVRLYKNRHGFIYKSIDEYILTYGNKDLEMYNYDLNVNSVEVINSIINSNARMENTLLVKEYNDKLDKNEIRFIDEINSQSEILSKVNRYKKNKEKFEEVINDESMKLLEGMEKIYSHFNQTMERVYEKGIKNINERKAIKIIELIQCFKQNLYSYFIKKMTALISLSLDLRIKDLLGSSILNELDNLGDNISKYIYEKYINESQWKHIIESTKTISVEYIEILKKYELELCITIKCSLIDNFKKENQRLKNSLLEVENIRQERTEIERNINMLKLDENNEDYNTGSVFKEIINANYVIEYNKIVESINNKDADNNTIVTYFEYLYLLTSEMSELEGRIFGE